MQYTENSHVSFSRSIARSRGMSTQAMTQLEQQLVHSGVIGDSIRQSNANTVAKAGKSGLEDLPSVQTLLPTLRNRLEALNGPEIPRLIYP